MRGLRVVPVYQRVLPKRLLEKEPWRKELLDLLTEYVALALYPTPYGLRQVAEVLMELRGIMLVDGVDHALTHEAMRHIRRWVEEARQGRSFDLGGLLRDLREYAESEIEGWVEDECED
jgi:hypothetical protein